MHYRSVEMKALFRGQDYRREDRLSADEQRESVSVSGKHGQRNPLQHRQKSESIRPERSQQNTAA